jgi:hypothetical protein
MRKGQANDSLQSVREALGHLSWQYKNVVRLAKTKVQKTRALTGAQNITQVVGHHRRVYNRCRQILLAIQDDVGIQYPVLAKEDCVVSTVVGDVNGRGQSNKKLVWFWSINHQPFHQGAKDSYMSECAWQLLFLTSLLLMSMCSLQSALAACTC